MSTNRNFATHPRTMCESFEIIRDAIQNDAIISRAYVSKKDSNKCCPIGHLMTPAQRADIIRHRANNDDIENLILQFGTDNIRAMTAMTRFQAANIIHVTDELGTAALTKYITKGLTWGQVRIGSTLFKLF